MALSAVQRVGLRAQVLDQLREAILNGHMAAGEHLNETELAAQFSVSRGTVREALRVLEEAGLAESTARGRLVVRSYSPREVTELYEVRSFLECGAAARVARSGDRDGIIEDLASLLPAEHFDDLAVAVEQDMRFHRRLCELAGNALLLDTWLGLESKMRVVIFAGAMTQGSDIPVIITRAHHEPLLDALRGGDEEEISRAFAEHMQRAGAFWVSQMGA